MSNIEMEMDFVQPTDGARIKVLGIGGAGNNAVDTMVEAGISKAEFVAVNTDAQQLKNVKAPTTVQIGVRLTAGLGAGAKPEIGKKSAEENENEIREVLKNTEMVFITAGMGGGTGTGAAPVVARIAKELGILTVAVVTKPFFFEGPQKMKNAEAGIEELSQHVDSIVTIPNDNLLKIAAKKIGINESLKLSDEVLRQGVEGIIEVITQTGLMNCDFADVCTIMRDSGVAHMGIGIGKGENAAHDAVRTAIESPLLETSIAGASNVLLNITGGEEFSLVDMSEISSLVREMVSQDATIIVGTTVDDRMKDEIKVTLIVTGLDSSSSKTSSPVASFQSVAPSASDFSSFRTQPTASSPKTDVFARKVNPGVDNVNVPPFLKGRN